MSAVQQLGLSDKCRELAPEETLAANTQFYLTRQNKSPRERCPKIAYLQRAAGSPQVHGAFVAESMACTQSRFTQPAPALSSPE